MVRTSSAGDRFVLIMNDHGKEAKYQILPVGQGNFRWRMHDHWTSIPQIVEDGKRTSFPSGISGQFEKLGAPPTTGGSLLSMTQLPKGRAALIRTTAGGMLPGSLAMNRAVLSLGSMAGRPAPRGLMDPKNQARQRTLMSRQQRGRSLSPVADRKGIRSNPR